ncbi:chemotaxis-specific protein-glutamate methyltransferase CheB [Anaeromyxobacter paludicola]|uniref:Protein-glutamate methylesterase/protein-glutamine glutaminase n=1 Tax=Anaeromyxobacter paludicola TaxID=2918171 RepID=A0ABM7XAB9_9BACT|nr:chemotaxis-specific protein-glutamate methyltransferase CheB [Anaeromyxobacter paludicola]BDG08800.1 chemotaxis response regulator protein-glutamate methylesterase [Anaeromyxobacter paludicola]
MNVPIRVLVVEDSLTIRKRLVEVLGEDPELQVVGEAEDGQRGVDLCRALRPDVVTLDMMMPVMTGVEAAEQIMAYCPTPILVVSASTNRGELFRTYDALAAGALDVLEKPGGHELADGWEGRLRAAVKLVSRIKVITHLRGRLAVARPSAPLEVAPVPPPAPARAGRLRAVAVGGSTGSPGAVLEILQALPRRFAAPVLLVVHINEPFGRAFADWLDTQSPLRVRYARDREPLEAASGVLMAPPGQHLFLERGLLRLDLGPERHSCRPSVDVLFESVARELGPDGLACLLTGMGRDGAAGMLAVRRAGGRTIAQDEATSVVFGMPREAILLGAAERVLPLGEIGDALAAAEAGGLP